MYSGALERFKTLYRSRVEVLLYQPTASEYLSG